MSIIDEMITKPSFRNPIKPGKSESEEKFLIRNNRSNEIRFVIGREDLARNLISHSTWINEKQIKERLGADYCSDRQIEVYKCVELDVSIDLPQIKSIKEM